MSLHFAITIRFLDARFHGRGDGGHPEWPPSPLRLFQALVAAAGARQRGGPLDGQTQAAFRWLEELSEKAPPVIIAPAAVTARIAYRLSVPNNAMDIVANAWVRGNDSNSKDADPRTHRTMKAAQPTHLVGGDTLHFLWLLPEQPTRDVLAHVELLAGLSRSVVALGWGIDLVVCQAAVISDELADKLDGEYWLPRDQGR